MSLAALTVACSTPQPQTSPATGFALPDAAAGDLKSAKDTPETAADVVASDTAEDGSSVTDGVIVDDTVVPDSLSDAAQVDETEQDPCAGITCSGHGTCYPLYNTVVCKCDPGYTLLGTTDCADVNVATPCNPNPCVEPDKTTCGIVGNEAVCACAPGFSLFNGACLFDTCPAISATTGLIVYDMTGASIAAGLDPLQPGDAIKVRTEIQVTSGTGDVVLELHPYNTTLDLARLACDATPCAGDQKGPVTRVPLHLTPGLHTVETTGQFLTAQGPLSLNARLVAGTGCEIPGARSAARVGALGVQDAKGMDCIDLDRTRAVQVTHDVAEKNTDAYGTANGQATSYVPQGSIVNVVEQCFSRKVPSALFLAGSPDGTLPWAVDNDLVIERYDVQPQPGDLPTAIYTVGTDALQSNQGLTVWHGPKPDVPGTHFGIPNGAPFGFSGGVVRLDDLVPLNKPVWLRFVALDYGVVGRLTRLFVIAAPMDKAPPRCLDNTQCPAPAGGFLGGCVQGQCTGATCDAANPCPINQFCSAGFCQSRCDQGTGACASGYICQIHACVAPGTVGQCAAAQKDQDCPPGDVCFAGRCTSGCHHPRHQDQSYASDPSFCAGQKPALCPHCPDPAAGCWNNVCAACEVDAECAAGEVCVDRACVSAWGP